MACSTSRSGPGRPFRSDAIRRTTALSAGGNVSIDISIIRPDARSGLHTATGKPSGAATPWRPYRLRGLGPTLAATDRAIRGSFAPCQAPTGALAVDVDTHDSGRTARGRHGPGH